MTPLNFAYHRPESISLATNLFRELSRQGERALYFAGGTEIITLGRQNEVWADSIIDINHIPETHILRMKRQELRIGSNLTLTELTDSPLVEAEFPLLFATVREIADRTARNKITLGGNVCGKIIYREAVLPLLVCDSRVVVANRHGIYSTSIHNVFRGTIRLQPGELIVGFGTERQLRHAPHVHIKRRKMGSVGYPIVSAAAIRLDGVIRVALSGVCDFPFRWRAGEVFLNYRGRPPAERVLLALRELPAPVLDDFEASREYRLFVLQQVLLEILQRLSPD